MSMLILSFASAGAALLLYCWLRRDPEPKRTSARLREVCGIEAKEPVDHARVMENPNG